MEQTTLKKIPIAHRETKRQQRFFFTTVFVLFTFSLLQLTIDWEQLIAGSQRAPELMRQLSQLSFEQFIPQVGAMITSIVIAFLAVIFSVVASLLLGLLAARNMTPHPFIGMSIRAIFIVVRAVPTTVWVLIAVASLGFGSMAGVVGLLFPTTAFLVKSFAAQIEEVGAGVIEAIRASGGSWFQIVTKGILPTLATQFLALIVLRFEMDIAESIILGMVGAGGIGLLIQGYISFYDFQHLTTALLIIFFTMVTIELATNALRKKIKN